MEKYRVIIVEDHKLARDKLKRLLFEHPDIDVVGEFDDIQSAWHLLETTQIDGVFLDITFDFSGGEEDDGLVLARRIQQLKPTPWLIFVTGSPDYAVVAHDFRPFGYILKPVDSLKLARCLDSVRVAFPFDRLPIESSPTLSQRIEIRYKVIRMSEDGTIEHLTFTRFLVSEEIDYICANAGSGGIIEVHLHNGEILKDVNINLNAWLDKKLPCFVQVRKNIIVNLKYVCGYRADSNRAGYYLLQFKYKPVELPIGSNYFAAFKEALKKCI